MISLVRGAALGEVTGILISSSSKTCSLKTGSLIGSLIGSFTLFTDFFGMVIVVGKLGREVLTRITGAAAGTIKSGLETDFPEMLLEDGSINWVETIASATSSFDMDARLKEGIFNCASLAAIPDSIISFSSFFVSGAGVCVVRGLASMDAVYMVGNPVG